MKWGLSLLLLWGVSGAASARPIDMRSIDWERIAKVFQMDQDKFQGQVNGAQTWRGGLCQGTYNYDVKVNGVLDGLNLTAKSGQEVEIHADTRALHVLASGKYRSSATLCVPLSGWAGVGAERAQLWGKMTYEDLGETGKLRVKILRTQFDKMSFGDYIPDWFASSLTELTNWGLKYVWGSSFGEWINQKLSDFIRTGKMD